MDDCNVTVCKWDFKREEGVKLEILASLRSFLKSITALYFRQRSVADKLPDGNMVASRLLNNGNRIRALILAVYRTPVTHELS